SGFSITPAFLEKSIYAFLHENGKSPRRLYNSTTAKRVARKNLNAQEHRPAKSKVGAPQVKNERLNLAGFEVKAE
ncbi:MAG: hypothetical protein AAGA87_10700, partial [Pseudomonadota bacterium]